MVYALFKTCKIIFGTLTVMFKAPVNDCLNFIICQSVRGFDLCFFFLLR